MASGTIKSYTVPLGSTGENARWSFEWTSTKKSAGVSIVTWNLYTRGRSTSPTWLKTACELSVGYNGTTTELYDKSFDGTTSDSSFKDKKRASGTFDVTHEPNGYASFTVYFNVRIYTGTWHSTQGLCVLDNLPTKAMITSATSFDDKHNPVVDYSNPSGTSVSSLDIAICATEDGTNPVIPYAEMSKTDSKYYFELTDSQFSTLCHLITSGDSTTVYFCIRTVLDGATYYDYKSATFSLADGDPVVRGTVVDVNPVTFALTGDANVLIKYQSNALAVMEVEAQEGAAIYDDTAIIRNGDKSGYGYEHTFVSIESNVFTFSAEDTRGNIGTDTVTATMIEYFSPTCYFGNNKPDGNGDMKASCTGNFFNGNFGRVSNSLTAQCRYREYAGTWSDWVDMSVTVIGTDTYSASVYLTGLDYKKTYQFEARVADYFDNWIHSKEKKVVSFPAFHWGENDFVFEVPVEFKAGIVGEEEGVTKTIDSDLNVTGDVFLTGDDGNTVYFGDNASCYIAQTADNVLFVKGKNGINLLSDGHGVYVDGNLIPILECGIWTPSLNTSAVNSYTTQYGWYSKMNQSVSVGFFIKANCASGWDTTNLTIYGLPFTPLYSAAGGGMCSGAYVSAGLNFQCFVVGTDGNITARVQSCNHTAQTNLSTSASGCKYPNGGGEITLSGTITFMSNS